MLQAISQDGRFITLATMKREMIEAVRRRREKFYCPVCGETVIMKAGSKTIAHFAHQANSDCPSCEGGEGMYHEQGKLLLYQWLTKHRMDVKLEPYIADIQQRPDILIALNDKRIAIEYQCARISVQEIQKRNKGYKSIGIIPIWIIGATHFTRYKANYFKLDQFTRQFIHQYTPDKPQVMYFFDPYTSQIAMIQDIFITRGTRAIGRIIISPLHQLKFPDLFRLISFTKTELANLWNVEKRYLRLRTNSKLYGNELIWRRWLYSKGLHPENIPSVIHLPISAQHQMKFPLWNWQSKICIEVIDPLPIGSTFSSGSWRRISRAVMHYPDDFPLIAPITNPIEQYLSLLESLNILKRVSATSYKKLQAFQFYKNVEEAILGDQLLVQQLFLLKSGKIQA